MKPAQPQQDGTGPRIIVRAEITEAAKETVELDCERKGMTQLALISRVVEWFARQPDTVRASIAGHLRQGDADDATKQALKVLAEGRNSSRHSKIGGS